VKRDGITAPKFFLPKWVAVTLLFLGLSVLDVSAQDAPKAFTLPKDVQSVLSTYCIECHGKGGKGNVNLTNLEQLKQSDRLDLLNLVQDQIFFKMMPPSKAEQLPPKEKAQLSDWVRTELRQHKASKLDEKLPYPDAGNYVDHEALFNSKSKEKGFSPARRWLVSPQIFQERVLDIFKLEGRERDAMRHSGFFGVTNPFVLPEHAGVRYYDLQTLDGGHLLAMLSNAEWISSKQLHAARVKSGEVKGMPEDVRDRWAPKTTPTPFEVIVLKKEAPTDDEIRLAIQTQFDLVLRRQPTDAEAKKYLEFTKNAVKLAGNSEGLRQMLKGVLLESEFVYRLEFGSGKEDEFGRKALSPREAAFAIAYAVGDRGPDPILMKAAQEGKLVTKADYEMQVQRLLKDPTYNRNVVDRSLGLGGSAVSSDHPSEIRFFREFFGYPMAVKVFKDTKRSGGYYSNADRGNTQTPGYLVNEADELVESILKQDKAVFETLLTTDKYFVFHYTDGQKQEAQIANWKKAYEILKDTDWKKNPDKVAEEHQETIKKYLDPKGFGGKHSRNHDNSVLRFMNFFESTFGKGKTPFTVTPWSHGNRFWYSTFYSLGSPPGRGSPLSADETLDYKPVQPFEIPNRKGILSHPAWLIAFASNSQTDPVKRGRWVREKLLAGVVPDVPITVDAKIPEDPHKTLRERLFTATESAACMKCHNRMNDLGYPFEVFDDFGRFRKKEDLEHPDNIVKAGKGNEQDVYKTKPINSIGFLEGTGDPKLDGKVTDALDLITKLSQSERVRQSIIRHAFRYYMGRNETLADSQTLTDADQAYLKSGGSFKAVIVSLLTSDSFRYRKQ